MNSSDQNNLSWSERDRRVVWHPFTQVQTAGPAIALVRGEGALLYDESGREYIDAVSSWWVNIHGHAHPYIAQRVSAQLHTLEHAIFAGFTHPGAVELCERLTGLLPAGQERVFFSDNGSTAVEVGLKMAMQFWWNQGMARHRIVAFENAYHGDTVGAMSAGGRSPFSRPFDPVLFPVEHLPVPDGANNADVLEQMRAILAHGDVAAFVYEPMVQGAGGMVMYDVPGMNALLELARSAGALLIADEVMTGFGRTGRLFASEYYGTAPDIMALSKGLTGGTMPLAVTTCRDHVFAAFLSNDKYKTFFHGHSYTGNPTACAAALASLDLVEAAGFRENIARIGARHKAFADSLGKHPRARQVRITGTILAFEVDAGDGDSYFNNLRDQLYESFIGQGVLLRPLGNTVYILPPYVITDGQLDRVYEVILHTLNGLEG